MRVGEAIRDGAVHDGTAALQNIVHRGELYLAQLRDGAALDSLRLDGAAEANSAAGDR